MSILIFRYYIGLLAIFIFVGCSQYSIPFDKAASGGGATNSSAGSTAGPTPGSNPGSTPAQGTPAVYLSDPTPSGRTLNVCPTGCPYTLPSQVLDASNGVLQDGDTVIITGGDYVDCATITRNSITIKGVSVAGSRPHLHGKVCGRKGILVLAGQDILVENLELSNNVDPTTNDENWAGIRIDDPLGSNIKVRSVYFHDGDEGILGSYNANSIEVVENSKFERLGRSGYAHGLYIGAIKLFVLRNSVVVDNHEDGHLVKTRALASIIECNQIAGLNGLNSYAVDVPQGGDAIIRGNAIEQGPNANNTQTIIAFAEEGAKNPIQSLSFYNNIVLNDLPSANFFWVNGTALFPVWQNNTLVGPGNAFNPSGVSTVSGFTRKTNRAEANLPAYDGSLNSMPRVALCP